MTAALGCGHTRPEPEGASVRAIDEIRAQHRTECVGFGECTTHPVPRVHFNIHTRAPVVIVGSEVIFPPGGYGDHAEALGEARRLATQQPQDSPGRDRTPRGEQSHTDTKPNAAATSAPTPKETDHEDDMR